MAGSAFAFQKMVFEALAASPAIAGGRVYDFVPDRTAYPFVSFDAIESNDTGGTTSAEGDSEVALTINVWTQQDGWLEPDTIASAIYARLHRTTLPQSTEWRAVFNYERDRAQIRDPDGKTRRVICRYRAYLERL
jgi:Protein of unknown function (DUF3168)